MISTYYSYIYTFINNYISLAQSKFCLVHCVVGIYLGLYRKFREMTGNKFDKSSSCMKGQSRSWIIGLLVPENERPNENIMVFTLSKTFKNPLNFCNHW